MDCGIITSKTILLLLSLIFWICMSGGCVFAVLLLLLLKLRHKTSVPGKIRGQERVTHGLVMNC